MPSEDMLTFHDRHFRSFCRQSSPTLSQAVIDGVEAAGGKVEDFGILSTPQLHYLVVCKNTKGQYGQPTETGYFDKISKAFAQFRGQARSNLLSQYRRTYWHLT